MLAVVPVDVRRDLLCGMDVDHVDDAWSLWSSAAEQGLLAACAHGGGPLLSEDPGARWLGWWPSCWRPASSGSIGHC